MLRSFLNLIKRFTVRADDNHATSVRPKKHGHARNKNLTPLSVKAHFSVNSKNGKVCVYFRIK